MATRVYREYGGNGIMTARLSANGTMSRTRVLYPGDPGYGKARRNASKPGASTGISDSDDKKGG